MLGREGDHDLRVQRPDGSGVAVGEIDPRIGQADIVDNGLQFPGRNLAADETVHFVGEPRGFLDAQAGRRAHVQPDGGGVDRGEEIFAQSDEQAKRGEAKQQERPPTARRRVSSMLNSTI